MYYFVYNGKLLMGRGLERVEVVGSYLKLSLDRDMVRVFYLLKRVEG